MAEIHGFLRQSNVQQQQQHHHPHSHAETLDTMGSWSDINNSDDPEPDLYSFDFDPLSPPNLSFFMPSASHGHPSDSESESDDSDSVTDPSCFYDRDQMIFVTDLFESRNDHVLDDSDSVSDPFLDDSVNNHVNFTVFGGSVDEELEFSSNYAEELELGLGIGNELDRVFFASESRESSATRGAESSADGLRVVGFESDSDSEDVDANSGVDDDGTVRVGDPDFPIFGNSLRFDGHRAGNEEFEWEEVDERVDEREGLSSVIDRIEEISVSSETSSEGGGGGGGGEAGHSGDEAVRNFEWEVLLAINSLERNLEFENDSGGYVVSYLAVQDDYVYATEYDTLFRQFVETESALRGGPPAAKSVVENLPSVVWTKEELQKNNTVCAVCKDDILVEEKVTRLPCHHHYHGDCILPWLSIRNTCPVCRYELPTDDADYEQRKNEQVGLGLLDDLQVRYNFEVLP